MPKFLQVTILVVGVLFALLHGTRAAAAITCGTATCGTGEACCQDSLLGPVCYNTTTHSCCEDRLLCGTMNGVPNGCCGTVCFDAANFVCCNNATGEICPITNPTCCISSAGVPCGTVTCGTGDLCCNDQSALGPACYNPATHFCCEDRLLCGFQHLPDTTEDGCCGSVCFDTVTHVCCNNSTGSICPITNPACCSTTGAACTSDANCGLDSVCCDGICIDATTSICCAATGLPCAIGDATCCPSTVGVACGTTNCAIGQSCCGATCYDPTVDICCNNTGVLTVCAPGNTTCCPVAAGPLTCGTSTCSSGDLCCADSVIGSTCYNPATHFCCEDRLLCGFQHLPDMTEDGCCGNICFDSLTYVCGNNATGCICPITNPTCCP